MKTNVVLKGESPVTAILEIEGLVESMDARNLRSLFEDIDKKGAKRVIVDLTGSSFICSAGISVLVMFSNVKRSQWGDDPVVLVGLAPAVLQAMNVLGLTGLFKVIEKMDEALTFYNITN
ncbi:MAG: STAS domain-containing protein [Planctomycetota bacterium]